MGKFASSKSQAASVMKAVQGSVIESVGTVRNFEKELKLASEFIKENELGSLRDMTSQTAEDYLNNIAADFSQSKVDMARLALQTMMRHVY